MLKVESDETEEWPGIPGKNRTNGRVLPRFHTKAHALQQALLKGGDVPVDSRTSMTEQEIAYILGKLKTSEARERFLRSL